MIIGEKSNLRQYTTNMPSGVLLSQLPTQLLINNDVQ